MKTAWYAFGCCILNDFIYSIGGVTDGDTNLRSVERLQVFDHS
jgi:hypothetical protein